MANSYATKARPTKPYAELPLFAHNNGQWARKIRGKLHCFGAWEDPKAALEKHNLQYPYLKEGIEPPEELGGYTVADLANEFLSVQEDRMERGEITKRTFDSLKYSVAFIVEYIDRNKSVETLKPSDFRKLRDGMASRFRPANLGTNITRIKQVFKFAYDERIIDRPAFHGQAFKPPTKGEKRKARNERPKKYLEPSQILAFVDAANPAVKAMILIAANTGMNNSDLKNMKFRHVDLETGWIDYPRHKTGIARRAPLWPETVKAIRDYLNVRQRPLEQFSDYVFITKARRQWGDSSLTHEFRKIRTALTTDEEGELIENPPGPTSLGSERLHGISAR